VVLLFPYDTTREPVCFIYGVLLLNIEQKDENTISKFVKNYRNKKGGLGHLYITYLLILLFEEFTGHARESANATQ